MNQDSNNQRTEADDGARSRASSGRVSRVVASRAVCAQFLPPDLYAEVAALDRWVPASNSTLEPGYTHPEAPGTVAALTADLPLRSWAERHRELFTTYSDEDLSAILRAWDLLEGHRRAVNIEMMSADGFLNTVDPGIYIAGMDAADTLGKSMADHVAVVLAPAKFTPPPTSAGVESSYYTWWYGVTADTPGES